MEFTFSEASPADWRAAIDLVKAHKADTDTVFSWMAGDTESLSIRTDKLHCWKSFEGVSNISVNRPCKVPT